MSRTLFRLVLLGILAMLVAAAAVKTTSTTVAEDEEETTTTTTARRTTRTTRTLTTKSATTTTEEEEETADEETTTTTKTTTTTTTRTAKPIKLTATPTTTAKPTTAAIPTATNTTIIPVWIPPPPPPHPRMPNTTINACSVTGCTVAVRGSKNCSASLAEAINNAPDGGVVEIGGDVTVTTEIVFSKSIELRSCGTGKHKVYADMNNTEGGMLRQLGNMVNVSLTNLMFEMKPNRTASVLRTEELPGVVLPDTNGTGTAPIDPPEGYKNVDVFIQGCTFSNFRTMARGGAVIFVGGTTWFTVVDSDFTGNSVGENGERYEGGGAIWIRSAQGWLYTFNNTRFLNNTHEFPHGTGGAIMINFLSQGYFEVRNGLFRGNRASGGGAIGIGSVENYAKVLIDSTFEYNHAVEYGWGSRGGVAWIQNVNGTVEIKGTYFNNTAVWDRGACFANNMLRNNGSVILGGSYTGNYAGKGGAVWDTLGYVGFSPKANFTVLANTEFRDNESNGTSRLIRLARRRTNENELLDEEDWENEKLFFEA